MSLFTSIGTGIWLWAPFRKLVRHQDDHVGVYARMVWIALYTTPEAKSALPGLWVGSIGGLAESSTMPVDMIRTGMDRLIEDDMIECDISARVIRMTELPDHGEFPYNGRAIRSWWRRYHNIPECQVRDHHVPVLRWILDTHVKMSGKPGLSKDHADAWRDTFGTLKALPLRVRKPRPFQADLFSVRNPRPNDFNHSGSTSVEQLYNVSPEPDQDHEFPESGRRTVLTLVPHPAFDADDLAQALHEATGGKFPNALTRDARVALGRAIDVIGDIAMHPSALAFLREYVASLTALRGAAGGDCGISLELVTSPGWIGLAIKRGMDWKESTDAAERTD